MEATDASRLVCVVVVSYQEYSLPQTQTRNAQNCVLTVTHSMCDCEHHIVIDETHTH